MGWKGDLLVNPLIRKATKKPVEIEYMVWPGDGESAETVINWIMDGRGRASYRCPDSGCTGREEGHTIAIDTLEGKMIASPGDVIIRGVKGEFYPCKPDIFDATYDIE